MVSPYNHCTIGFAQSNAEYPTEFMTKPMKEKIQEDTKEMQAMGQQFTANFNFSHNLVSVLALFGEMVLKVYMTYSRDWTYYIIYAMDLLWVAMLTSAVAMLASVVAMSASTIRTTVGTRDLRRMAKYEVHQVTLSTSEDVCDWANTVPVVETYTQRVQKRRRDGSMSRWLWELMSMFFLLFLWFFFCNFLIMLLWPWMERVPLPDAHRNRFEFLSRCALVAIGGFIFSHVVGVGKTMYSRVLRPRWKNELRSGGQKLYLEARISPFWRVVKSLATLRPSTLKRKLEHEYRRLFWRQSLRRTPLDHFKFIYEKVSAKFDATSRGSISTRFALWTSASTPAASVSSQDTVLGVAKPLSPASTPSGPPHSMQLGILASIHNNQEIDHEGGSLDSGRISTQTVIESAADTLPTLCICCVLDRSHVHATDINKTQGNNEGLEESAKQNHGEFPNIDFRIPMEGWFNHQKILVQRYCNMPISWWPLAPPVYPGMIEVVFKCVCGKTIVDVVPIDQVEVVRKFYQQLHIHYYNGATANATSTSGGGTHASVTGSTPASRDNKNILGTSSAGGITNQNPESGTVAIQICAPVTAALQSMVYVIFFTHKLLHCLDISSQTQKQDSVFFERLRQTYESQTTRIQKIFTYTKLEGLQWTRFKRIHRYIESDPKQYCEPKQNNGYKYHPDNTAPPPLSSQLMLHFYNYPHDTEDGNPTDFLIQQMPKRIEGPNPNKEELAWGLIAIEGISCAHIITWALVVVFLAVFASIVFIYWWLIRHPSDLQNAFVPIFTVFTVLAVVFSAAQLFLAAKDLDKYKRD